MSTTIDRAPRVTQRRSSAPVGRVLELVRDPLEAPRRWQRELGDVVRVRVPGLSLFVVGHPDLVETVLTRDARSYKKDAFTRGLRDALGDGLVTSEGDTWRRHRRLANPAFQHDEICGYAASMVRLSEQMLARWDAHATRDLHADMMGLTLAIVARTLFGADLAERAGAVGSAVSELMQHYSGILGTGLRLPWCIPTPSNLRARRAVRRLDEVTFALIAERRARGGEPDDLLGRLIAASDEHGAGLSDRELRDEVVTLLVAGHETTAVALTTALYLLAVHPRVEALMRAELDALLAGRAPSLADLPRMVYTERVVTEAMRLYPPVWSLGREAAVDVELGGFPIKKGAQVFFYPYAIQRDARFFERPDEFLPERWEGGLAQRLPHFAYFPFGGGARACIGQRFARMEAELVLATLVQRFALRLAPGERLDLLPSITLRPRHGLRMIASRVAPQPAR